MGVDTIRLRSYPVLVHHGSNPKIHISEPACSNNYSQAISCKEAMTSFQQELYLHALLGAKHFVSKTCICIAVLLHFMWSIFVQSEHSEAIHYWLQVMHLGNFTCIPELATVDNNARHVAYIMWKQLCATTILFCCSSVLWICFVILPG